MATIAPQHRRYSPSRVSRSKSSRATVVNQMSNQNYVSPGFGWRRPWSYGHRSRRATPRSRESNVTAHGAERSCAPAAPRDEAQMQEDHFFGGGPLGGRGRELKAMGPWRVLDNRSV